MRAAGDGSDAGSVVHHRRAVSWDVSRGHAQTEEPPARPALLYFHQRIAPDEVAFVQLDRPPEARLVCVDGLVHVVAPKAQRSLEPCSIACAKARRQYPMWPAFLEDGVPDTSYFVGVDEELEAVLACVSSPGDERVH